jgi:ATP-dependent helicase/nuclease subunit B
MNFLGGPGPRWFNIEAGQPFLEDLARGLLGGLADGGSGALAAATVLVPTRRAGRDLAEAFLQVSDQRALLLPQIRALGDLDEGEPPFEPGELVLDLPPAISTARRRFELARLAADHDAALGRSLDANAALELADALASFLDSVEIEEATPLERLDSLAPEELARHWQATARFLQLTLTAWPERLAALGLMDVGARRAVLLRRLAERWRSSPPDEPVIAAGSTGSAPAVADLLAVIADLPKGAVVLPGLDLSLAASAWDEIGEEHPQGALKRLLSRAGVGRDQVSPWPGAGRMRGRWRRRLINEALRPAEVTDDWLAQIANLRAEGQAEGADPIAEGLSGLSIIHARGEEEAACVAALLLREALETPGRTAVLVTPDAGLGRRASACLTRWGVAVDSSAGASLAGYPVATLVALVARLAFDSLDPVVLLAIAKHRLVRAGLDAASLAIARRGLERALRGPRPASWDAINTGPLPLETRALADALRASGEAMGDVFAGGAADPVAAAARLAEQVEALARDHAGELGDLWGGAGGEAAAALIAGLIDEGDSLPAVGAAAFAELIEGLVAREVVRSGGATHPRVRILGVLEARLARADLIVLAGLEEGEWPQPAPVDPFLSRPMRADLGLPPPERRLGLSAHDFAQGACAPDVALIACERRDGAPVVQSRWLWRLETLVKGAGLQAPGRDDILELARALDAPSQFAPAPRPRPRPPLAVRPRTLPVTGIEQWVRDPYSVYARHILRLRPLLRPGEPIDALIRGTAVHAAFERFAKAHPQVLPDEAEGVFADLLIDCLAEAGAPAPSLARERALAANLAPWVIAFERRRREGARLLIEQQGSYAFAAPGGPFTVTARADRIELRDGLAHVLDFKTGSPPSQKQVESGISPQLTLTAAILMAGGFTDIGPADVGELLYVRVSGGRIPGRVESRGESPTSAALAEAALSGLKRRVASFDSDSTPYVAWAAPQFMSRYGGDYDHLGRHWEWGVIGGDQTEGAA